MISFQTRSSNGMNQFARLVRDGQVLKTSDFASYIRRQAGMEEWEYEPQTGERLLLVYRSGSGSTETVTDLVAKKVWNSLSVAEREIGHELW